MSSQPVDEPQWEPDGAMGAPDFRAVAENASDAIITIDAQDRILFANRSAERIFGYTGAELLALPFTSLIPEHLRGPHRAGLKRYVDTGTRRVSWEGIELPGLHKNGEEFPLEVTFGHFMRGDGHFFTGIMRDISGRKRAERERAELLERERQARGEAERHAREEQALREAAAAVAASLTTAEVVREIAANAVRATNASGAFVERFHVETGEVEVVAATGEVSPPAGTRVDYHGSFAQQVIESALPRVIGTLASGGHIMPDLAQVCSDCSAVAIPLHNQRQPIGALVLLRSPGEQPFRDDELVRARAFGHLASLAFHRVRLLEESERRRSELEHAIESRARLIRGFTHDLKNPLGAADGHAQLLETGRRGPLLDAQRQNVAHIRTALRSALSLIEDLLELARAEAGQLEIEWSDTDVSATARTVVGEFRATAEQAGFQLELQENGPVPSIVSDSNRIRQILGNLISNAIKYSHPGGRVVVHVHREAQRVAVDVRDTGPGIPSDQHAHLFEEFWRSDPHAAAPGTGLGLAISRRVALLLGGDICVESEPGRGSTFTLLLPPERSQPAPVKDARPSLFPASTAQPADAPTTGDARAPSD
jgi:PAS domain S-box-containing protein